MLGTWMNHKLESRFPGEISTNLRYEDDATLMEDSEAELKSFFGEGERRKWKNWLKTQH